MRQARLFCMARSCASACSARCRAAARWFSGVGYGVAEVVAFAELEVVQVARILSVRFFLFMAALQVPVCVYSKGIARRNFPLWVSGIRRLCRFDEMLMHNGLGTTTCSLRFCRLVLICPQMPVFRVFSWCEQKMTSSVSGVKQCGYWIHDNSINRVIHRL